MFRAEPRAPCSAALFPNLRAAADLLMMPKEALTDGAIRAEMLPGLGLGRVVRLLQRFTPDDFAQEPLPKGDALPVTFGVLHLGHSVQRRQHLAQGRSQTGAAQKDFPVTCMWVRLAMLGMISCKHVCGCMDKPKPYTYMEACWVRWRARRWRRRPCSAWFSAP